MITSWRVCNFKSVTDETKLQLAPLTLFTGANSAGKSTIIQSMLLTAQTIQSSVISRPVVLNGHMARLGSYKDLVSSGDEEKNISIGFEIRADLIAGRSMSPTGAAWRPMLIRPGISVEKVAMSYSFSAMPGPNEIRDKELLRLQPSLIETDLSVSYVEKGKRTSDQVVIRRSNETIAARQAHLKLTDAELQDASLESLRYAVAKSPRSRGYSGRVEGLELYVELVGAHMQHFLPRSFSGRFDEVGAIVASQVSLLTEPAYYRRQASFTGWPLSDEAVHFIGELLQPLLSETSPVAITSFARTNLVSALSRLAESRSPDDFAIMVRRLSPRDQSQIYSILSAEKAKISTLLRGSRVASYDLEVQFPNDQLSYGMDVIQNFFGSSVKYLGPLRDEPKPVYPLAGTADPADVGFRGEHTAAVLDIHRNKLIDYVPSAQFSAEWMSLKPQKIALSTAVQDWLEYMGVGRDFFTSDLGKLGHELKIRTAGSDLQHDLTQVGVGVSQVLPILVLALLADPGSTLIFEQPELHLHPRVQSRLADFFVSMTRLGKQCIVETHSEYIINRLRLRAASELGSDIAASSIIYFVEKHQSKSSYRRVSIDQLGGLDNWPVGFFDEGELATTALLKQSLKKRKESQK
jgi:predicted ATPase